MTPQSSSVLLSLSLSFFMNFFFLPTLVVDVFEPSLGILNLYGCIYSVLLIWYFSWWNRTDNSGKIRRIRASAGRATTIPFPSFFVALILRDCTVAISFPCPSLFHLASFSSHGLLDVVEELTRSLSSRKRVRYWIERKSGFSRVPKNESDWTWTYFFDSWLISSCISRRCHASLGSDSLSPSLFLFGSTLMLFFFSFPISLLLDRFSLVVVVEYFDHLNGIRLFGTFLLIGGIHFFRHGSVFCVYSKTIRICIFLIYPVCWRDFMFSIIVFILFRFRFRFWLCLSGNVLSFSFIFDIEVILLFPCYSIHVHNILTSNECRIFKIVHFIQGKSLLRICFEIGVDTAW